MTASPLLVSLAAEAPPALAGAPRGPDARVVVVAARGIARVFSARATETAAASLVERGAIAAPATLTGDRDFAEAVVARVRDAVASEGSAKVVLVAPPGTLGLLREPLQHALGRRITVMALARDYSGLSPAQLSEVIDLS